MKRIMTKLAHKGPMPPKRPPERLPERLPLQEMANTLTLKERTHLEELPRRLSPKRMLPKRKR